jgi:hypothetical protein
MKVLRESSGIALLYFLDLGTRRGEGSASSPGRFLPPRKNRYPLYRRLGGPQGRSGQVQKISPPRGFDSRTGQPVASRKPTTLHGPSNLYLSSKNLVRNDADNPVMEFAVAPGQDGEFCRLYRQYHVCAFVHFCVCTCQKT